jgi:two-component system, probable response regulator PhcQ
MYRILLIDDEPNILSALRRCLAAIDVSQLDGEALKIETFTSPEAAVERCEEQDFDLMISDYRMPSMTGVEVLSRLMEIQPGAPRMIISGFADREAIIAAVNEVHLTRFVEKPWNDQELRRTVVTILGAAAKRVVGDRADSRVSSSSPDRHLRRLEEESPGITQFEQADDGGILIAFDERDD